MLSKRFKRNVAIRFAMSNSLEFKKVKDFVNEVDADNEEELFYMLEKEFVEDSDDNSR